MAPSQAPPNTALIEAFSYGFSEFGHELSDRSKILFHDLEAVHAPLAFVEAQGAKASLVDKLYMRRDHLEHQAVIAVMAWAKRFALDVPVDIVYKALPDKNAIVQILADTVSRFSDLDSQLRSIVTDAHTDARAEGVTAAGSILNHSKGVPVPDIGETHAKELKKAAKSNAHGKTTDAGVLAILSGLAGDIVLHTGALVNQGKDADQVKKSIQSIVAAGAGAAFYLGSTTHANYAAAQKQHIADAGEEVDFTTSGDFKVCPQCDEAEAGNPWKPDEVPPIPYHGGCRCWYTPAGAIT